MIVYIKEIDTHLMIYYNLKKVKSHNKIHAKTKTTIK